MKTITFYLFFLITATTLAEDKTSPNKAPCPYPEDPINWVAKYCGLVSGTDDEITIQNSKCFKDAQIDLKNKDLCLVKKNYKTKTCEFLIKEKYTKHKSVSECLNDKSVVPFFAGGD